MMKLEVLDNQGWSRRFEVNKRIAYVGSGSKDDVVLDATRAANNGLEGSVQPRHFQLIDLGQYSLDGRPLYQLVNLADEKIRIRPALTAKATNEIESEAERAVGGLETSQVMAGERIGVGGFVLTLVAGFAAAPGDATLPTLPTLNRKPIGLELELPSTVLLKPDRTLTGKILIRNDGPNNAVQFVIEISGLPHKAYTLNGAAPQLFPGRAASMDLLLHHPCSPELTVGSYELTVTVTAPKDYDDVATVRRTIQVEPCYRHKLTVKPSAAIVIPAVASANGKS